MSLKFEPRAREDPGQSPRLRDRRHPWLHGQARHLHAMIAEDLKARPIALPLLLHIGDYVDKGPDSAGVLDRLTRGPSPIPGLACVNLMGNHERTMARCAGGRARLHHGLALHRRARGAEELARRARGPGGWAVKIPTRASGIRARPEEDPPPRQLPLRPCRHPPRRAARGADRGRPAAHPQRLPEQRAQPRLRRGAWPYAGAARRGDPREPHQHRHGARASAASSPARCWRSGGSPSWRREPPTSRCRTPNAGWTRPGRQERRYRRRS